ncbi:kynurenine 3-monooxygenase mitochondrial precursor [Scheffersomyces xylosifermentans]|uniref:kynurenine 3-monooxygenase mitochondrial precursor n=1 Tax=Scheffersomyces xylosifermentans TaxID=1304137 RepID=UPI00315D15BA
MTVLETVESSTNRHQGVGIVGAGLVGCLAALAFAAKGYSVTLFELRSDPKTDPSSNNLRSINLAVSSRGIRALKYVDEEMADRILEHITPMKGRMIHDVTGTKQESQLYGLFGECINSVDRSFLNDCLLDEIRHSDIKLLFNHKLIKLAHLEEDSEIPSMTFIDTSLPHSEPKTFEFDYLVGADGAFSQFRYQMQKFVRMNFSQNYVDMQYLELYIPPNDDPKAESKFAIDANHLHIWPRHNFMLIALANKDGSFTSTFFSPWSVIEAIKSTEEWLAFFKANFPDAYKLMGEERLSSVFENHPRGALMQVDVYPYHTPNGRAILIGDAAHSMVPFYGQGMNCGFEDVRVLMESIDKNNGDITKSFKTYTDARKKDLNAICKLAMDNFNEMSSKVTSPWFLLRKKIDYTLGRYANGVFFTWLPLYPMISFRDDIPYSKALEIEERQHRILNGVQAGGIAAIAIFGLVKLVQAWDKFGRSHL